VCGSIVTQYSLEQHKKSNKHVKDEQDFFAGCEEALNSLCNCIKCNI